jgi:uncharacterized protein YjiS (DUF1127 family)
MSLSHLIWHKVSFAEGPNSADIASNRLAQETKMSSCSQHQMINHHDSGILAQLSETFHVWRDRQRQRRELAQWTERDLHDVGLSWSDIAHEAEKPFWRA